MRRWIARAGRMTTTDYVTAIEVLATAIWIEAALRIMPFSRLLRRVERPSAETPSWVPDPAGTSSSIPVPDLVRRLLRFVVVAYEILPFPLSCLRRSLVLHGLLERRAVRSRVCIGVARNGAVLDAHAWIECEGVVVDEDHARFSELALTLRP